MKIYIAGPMTGRKWLNFPSFYAEAYRLRAIGHEVVNPAELNSSGIGWADAMRTDIAKLVTCEAIQMLPGWELSKGANLELKIAQELGITISFLGLNSRF